MTSIDNSIPDIRSGLSKDSVTFSVKRLHFHETIK